MAGAPEAGERWPETLMGPRLRQILQGCQESWNRVPVVAADSETKTAAGTVKIDRREGGSRTQGPEGGGRIKRPAKHRRGMAGERMGA